MTCVRMRAGFCGRVRVCDAALSERDAVCGIRWEGVKRGLEPTQGFSKNTALAQLEEVVESSRRRAASIAAAKESQK